MPNNKNNFPAEVMALKSEIRNLNTRLALNKAAFLNVAGKSLDGVVIVDQEKMVVYANYASINLFDRNIADLLGKPLDLNFSPKDIFSHHDKTIEIVIPKSNNAQITVEVSVLAIEWNNQPSYVVSFHDITARKKTEELLDYMSSHDFLTDLPNRINFEKKIMEVIQEAHEQGQYIALFYVDLDNFKLVNDTFGHEMGDRLLKMVAIALQKHIRKGDMLARIGGDEFAIILRGLRKPEYAATIARKLLDTLATIATVNGKEVLTNASIGIAIYPLNGTSPVELIQNADTAMYVAKTNGKGQYRFFTEELQKMSERSLLIVNGLRHVIPKSELFLNYQPIINIQTGTCVGVEALLRWQNPTLGLISPMEFLPYMERAGMMPVIDAWVIQRACEEYSQFKQEDLFISINLSINALDGIQMVGTILSNIQNNKISMQDAVFELTETSKMIHPDVVIKKFKKLSKLGIRFAIDDYGAGYSSLSYLKFPVAILKIDQSFINKISKNARDRIVIESTIQLAHRLGLKVIAEGVETKDQLAFLQAHNCDYVQGFYFSKPLSVEDLKKYIIKKNG